MFTTSICSRQHMTNFVFNSNIPSSEQILPEIPLGDDHGTPSLIKCIHPNSFNPQIDNSTLGCDLCFAYQLFRLHLLGW
jgi:hypothetical protein